MRSVSLLFCACVLWASGASHSGVLTIEQILQIKHPSNPVWSPDGKHIAFIWDEGGVANLYVTDASGTQVTGVKLTNFKDGQVGNQFWSKDSQIVYFPHNGSLWEVGVGGGEPHSTWTANGRETEFVLSPDQSKLAFVRRSNSGVDLYVRDLGSSEEHVATHDDQSIGSIVWSPNGQKIAFVAGAKSILHEEAPSYSGAKILFTTIERVPGKLYVVTAGGGNRVSIDAPPGFGSLHWSDSDHVILDRQTDEYKKRVCYVADVTSGNSRVLHEDVDEKFWSMPYGAGDEPQASPDGKWVMYLSDRDGWDHLYVMPAAGGTPVQITKGHFESWRPQWSHDSKSVAYDANSEDHPGDRQLFVATLNGDPAHASIRALTSGKGTNISALWSPDDKYLVYQHTDPQNSPDFFVIGTHASATPVRISESMPAGMDHSAFVEPRFVHFPGADGRPVPGWLFVPKNLDLSKKHPAIVWIHGDGINQNYDGWHVQRNYAVYYSFHQYLLQQGYIVFAPDYRGSIGYGRAWRQGVYMDIGGKDAKDAWMSAEYLKTLPYVDADRIGVWGLSYGGFFTLIAVTDQPKLFRAAVDVAGVVDYKMYYEDPYHGAWTVSRIGTPEQHPDVYARASPISHIDQLQRPLLILHGTADVNVPFLESVRLIDEGLKHGKGDLIQFMMYPGEFHYFDRQHVLEDAWHRVDRFFAANLQSDAANPSESTK